MSATKAGQLGADVRAAVTPPGPPVFRGRQLPFLGLTLVLACVLPFLSEDRYSIGLMNNALIYALLTLGFYWCFALSGLFTFAVFAFYAVGAYVSVWAANTMGGFWWGPLAAVVVTAALGGLTKLVFARCSEIYFAIATMAVGSVIVILFQQWTSFTGSFAGLSDIARPSFFGMALDDGTKRFFLNLGVLAFFLLLTALFVRSPMARDLTMARDKSAVASVTGLRPGRVQLLGFAVGSGIQGAAGSLYAHGSGYFSVEAFSIDLSLLVLLMLLLGGIGSMYGPVIGAAVLVYLPEMLRDLETYAEIIYAAAILLVIVAFPGGIAGVRDIVEKGVRRARGL